MLLPRHYYAAKVLTCPARKEVELPYPRDYECIRIEQDLFQWRLYYSRSRYIVCKSEFEARYLKVWLEHGIDRVEIPVDEAVLEKVTKDVEEYAAKIDAVIERKVVGYKMDTQFQLKCRVWRITQDVEEDQKV